MHVQRRTTASGRRIAIGATTALVFAVATATTVAASTGGGHPHVTRGEVIAAFQARTTGGFENLLAGRTRPAPIRGLTNGRITSFTSGRSYCSQDWHYLGISFLVPGTHRVAAALLRQYDVTFAIDGAPVPVSLRSPVKRFVDGTHANFGISFGALVPPGSIEPGVHTLVTVLQDPVFGESDLTVDFEMLAAPC